MFFDWQVGRLDNFFSLSSVIFESLLSIVEVDEANSGKHGRPSAFFPILCLTTQMIMSCGFTAQERPWRPKVTLCLSSLQCVLKDKTAVGTRTNRETDPVFGGVYFL